MVTKKNTLKTIYIPPTRKEKVVSFVKTNWFEFTVLGIVILAFTFS